MSWLSRQKRKLKKVVRKVASSDLVQKGVAMGVSSFVPGGAGIVAGYKSARKAKSLLSKGRSIARAVSRPSVVRSVAAGAAGGYAAQRLTSTASKAIRRSTMSSLPQLSLVGKTSGPGLLPRGPGGKLQWPWQDPNVPAQLENFACDDGYLSITYRAPKGFVLWRNANGKPFGLWKPVARMMGWKPKRKPPISVGDYQALMRADRTVKKMQSIVRRTKRLRAVKAL